MSYDLMVFDPDQAPRGRAEFLDWYNKQTEWGEDHDYNDPEVTTPALKAWFFDMIEEYPALNGPYATGDVDDPNIADYSFGYAIIYVGFGWPEADRARKRTFETAKKHRVGFFDVSSRDGGVWVPTASGGFERIHGEESHGGGRFGLFEW